MTESVLKAGGSSLSSAANVRNVARLVIEHYFTNLDTELNVVASAFGAEPGGSKDSKVTDRALAAANYALEGKLDDALSEISNIRDIHYRIIDELRLDRSIVEENLGRLGPIVISFSQDTSKGASDGKKLLDEMACVGELSSTPVLAAAVQKQLETEYRKLEEKLKQSSLTEREQLIFDRLSRCNGQYVSLVQDPGKAGFVTDSSFTNAELLDKSLDDDIGRHHALLREKNGGRIIFYPGFVSQDGHGNRTTLGRDGSNVTAVALATAIKAREVVIYSDEDGVLIADPKFLGASQTARHLSYHEASFLARWGGMKALQDNSLRILNRKVASVPIYVKNSFNPLEPGTVMTPESIGSYSTMKGIGIIQNLSYMEYVVGSSQAYQKIRELLGNYDGVQVLWSSFEEGGGTKKARFLLKKNPAIEKSRGKAHFEDKLAERIDAQMPNSKSFQFHKASLITICGEGLGNSRLGLSRIEEILSGVSMEGAALVASLIYDELSGIGQEMYRFPVIKGQDFVQVVVPQHKVEDVVQSLYNDLKRINIVLYGLGNVGLEFLRKAIEAYDLNRLNVVAIRDTSGTCAKLGGFSAKELKDLALQKERKIKIKDMDHPEGSVYFSDGNFRRVFSMGKGDFVFVDATDQASTASTVLHALSLGSMVISVNKAPYAASALSEKDEYADRNVRKLFEAIFERRLFNRGTVGADLGVMATELYLLRRNSSYMTIKCCASGTLGYTCAELDKGSAFSDAVRVAIQRGIAEPAPYADYSGMDVLNKITILWRAIAVKYGKNIFDRNVKYESFIDPAIRIYEEKTGEKFDKAGLKDLKEQRFVERVQLLDGAFAQIKAALPLNHVLRYVAEINYDPKTGYSLSVGPSAVHQDSLLGSLDGTDNAFLFGLDGPPKRQYGIEAGPGAGIGQTVNAIMHDLREIEEIVRGESGGRVIPYPKYKRKPKGPRSEPIRWSPPSIRARELLATTYV